EKVYNINTDKNIPYEDIEVMITYGLEKDWKLLDQLINLKWIQFFKTGVEQVPIDILRKRNIQLTNVRNIYGEPMSEYTMSLVLFQVREIERFINNKKLKSYDRSQLVDEA